MKKPIIFTFRNFLSSGPLQQDGSHYSGANMRNLVLIGLLSILGTLPAMSQDTPRVEVFGGYSLLHDGNASPKNFQGWDASSTTYLNHWFGLTADFSGHYSTTDGSFLIASGVPAEIRETRYPQLHVWTTPRVSKIPVRAIRPSSVRGQSLGRGHVKLALQEFRILGSYLHRIPFRWPWAAAWTFLWDMASPRAQCKLNTSCAVWAHSMTTSSVIQPASFIDLAAFEQPGVSWWK